MVEFALMASCTQTSRITSPSLHPDRPSTDWQAILADSVRSPAELCRLLDLDPALATDAERATAGLPLLVPRPYLARIRPGDPADPLLLQVLPCPAERLVPPGCSPDPLGERAAQCEPGLLRKYQGRLLIVTTGSCAVHCRFCFRRHFPYQQTALNTEVRAQILRQIAANRTIHEVILSGGDPLTLPDDAISHLAEELAEIPHLRRLRIHTRLPVMIPQRVTAGLISAIRGCRLSPMMVVHVNHPAEIDADVADALGRLVDAGIPVLNQSVLLRGVNDRTDVLAELSQRLVDLRVIPYYLHQIDRVAGVTHFEVPIATGMNLMAELRARLPGYAVPRYVRETPGASCKEVLA
jgi:EF-P beta-lysylation protein EpmB